jgi:hypothetical protein
MIKVEKSIVRLTEPIPPFEARLLRETRGGAPFNGGEDDASLSMPCIEQENTLFGMRLSDVVPDWDAKVEAALGAGASDIKAKISNFATLGIPKGDFTVSYGYRVDYCIIKGCEADRKVETHRSLLMGCRESAWHPGDARDALDALYSSFDFTG